MANWHDKDLVYKQHEAMRNAATEHGMFNGQAQLGNALAPPAPMTPLQNVVNDLRRKTAALESLLEAMEVKLGPVLVVVPESPMKDPGNITAPQSQVVMELGEIEYRLGQLCRRVDTLMSRVQV